MVLCIILVLMPTMVYASNTGTKGGNTKDEIDKAETQEKELKQQLDAVQATIDALKSDIDDTVDGTGGEANCFCEPGY